MSETAVWNQIDDALRPEYPEVCIVHIDRVVNPALVEAYDQFKAGLNAPKELWAWHGTSLASVDAICAEGFNPAFNTRSAYGKGTYVSSTCRYSLEGFAPKAHTDLCYVFYCRLAYAERKKEVDTRRLIAGEVSGTSNIYCAPRPSQVLPVYVVAFYRGR
jgi:Poly(ADP-ribose) polymerase catalytic domain